MSTETKVDTSTVTGKRIEYAVYADVTGTGKIQQTYCGTSVEVAEGNASTWGDRLDRITKRVVTWETVTTVTTTEGPFDIDEEMNPWVARDFVGEWEVSTIKPSEWTRWRYEMAVFRIENGERKSAAMQYEEQWETEEEARNAHTLMVSFLEKGGDPRTLAED